MTVAVLDTGIDLHHPELEGRVAARKDVVDFEGLETSEFIGELFDVDDYQEDDVGHGTHVAGIIAGRRVRMPEGVSYASPGHRAAGRNAQAAAPDPAAAAGHRRVGRQAKAAVRQCPWWPIPFNADGEANGVEVDQLLAQNGKTPLVNEVRRLLWSERRSVNATAILGNGFAMSRPRRPALKLPLFSPKQRPRARRRSHERKLHVPHHHQ